VSIQIHLITIDCSDPDRLAEFWAAALGFKITYRADDGGEVAVEREDESGPALLFIRVPDLKVVKNRIHFDLNPDDQAAEVERLEGLGATPVDIGQGEVTWVVMADPEGNEFCVLTPR
jgi:catechol 2,3-dioxygenase-like lactoylglutathione lyase family enzyme